MVLKKRIISQTGPQNTPNNPQQHNIKNFFANCHEKTSKISQEKETCNLKSPKKYPKMPPTERDTHHRKLKLVF